VLSRLHPLAHRDAEGPQDDHARRTIRVSRSGPLYGGILGSVLLAWCVLVVTAPELGSLLAVLGSPVVAFFVIVRLLTPDIRG
jgi:hypothetical protein